MKYGYLFYQKPLISDMPSRPVNLGDPIQSYAVKLLYREMGIEEKDIVPVPRYDMRNYDGEECVCIVNTCSTYEELAYDSNFMPPSDKIHAIPFSLHINRNISDDEIAYYRSCSDVGCRDIFTENKLRKLGVNAYLTGCLSLTFPRRSRRLEDNAKNVYLIDVQSEFKNLIPSKILDGAIELSSIYRFEIVHKSNRMTVQEACDFHKMGERRIELLKRDARLVITSRLHAAAPCLAMGIPVILTKYDDRFGFIDRFLPSYTNWREDHIDWNPRAIDIEREKNIIKQAFFTRVRYECQKIELAQMWGNTIHNNEECEPQVKTALKKISFPKNKHIKYAVLGVISSVSYFIPEAMEELYPNSELVCGIDSYVKNNFFNKPTVHIEKIEEIGSDVIIITAIKAAYKSAEKSLCNRPYIIINGKQVECRNLCDTLG